MDSQELHNSIFSGGMISWVVGLQDPLDSGPLVVGKTSWTQPEEV